MSERRTEGHRIQVGLGDALERWGKLNHRYRSGLATAIEVEERRLLAEALNSIKVHINASCVPGEDMNRDGLPDTLEFVEMMAKSDCCVLQHQGDAVREGSKEKKKGKRL